MQGVEGIAKTRYLPAQEAAKSEHAPVYVHKHKRRLYKCRGPPGEPLNVGSSIVGEPGLLANASCNQIGMAGFAIIPDSMSLV